MANKFTYSGIAVRRNSAHLSWPSHFGSRDAANVTCQLFGKSTDRADQRNYGLVLHAISSGCPIVV